MEAYLRRWMQDALAKHQYDSAIYVGDKLLAITSMSPSTASTSNQILTDPC